MFSEKQTKFLESMEECRLATAHDNIPHVKPVSYILDGEFVLIATDYDTRTYKNLKVNPNVGLVIDIYKHGDHKAVCIQGKSVLVENGKVFLEIYKKFHDKFEWVRKEPWQENEAPFIKITPTSVTSWGIE